MAQEPNRTDTTRTQTENHSQVQVQKEQNTMFDFELKIPEYAPVETFEQSETAETWADRTCVSKRSLKRFLETLTPTQLAQANVMVDDDSYIVFYPILSSAGVAVGSHFDDGGLSTDSSPFPSSDQSLIANIDKNCRRPKPAPKTLVEISAKKQSSDFGAESQPDRQQALTVLLSSVRLL